MKKFISRSLYLGILICLTAVVVSCEEDFNDINSSVLTNSRFNTASVEVDITVKNSPLKRIQSDNISRSLGQYLLGVYASPDYEKLEASIVSQVAITTGLKVIDDANVYGADTTVVTKMDTVFLKIPYQVSLNSTGDAYELDSIVGDTTKTFSLNVYRSNTYMNLLNPSEPTQINKFYSNDVFEKTGDILNAEQNMAFKPSPNDTAIVIKRRLFDDSVATTDTLRIFSSAASSVQIPFLRIPLNEEKFKELFLDKYESSDFESQEAFNNYFRGLIVEATGTEGSLISFNFNNTNTALNPTIEAYYTNTVVKSGTTILDTISKNNSFPLSGFRVNNFTMNDGSDKDYPDNGDVIIQGTAGNEGEVTLLDQAKITELSANNWLITDASLIFYVNQSKDVSHIPDRLYLYKNKDANNITFTQVLDANTESALGGIAGQLEEDEEGQQRYVFKVTDYVSRVLSGEIENSLSLFVKTFNPSDLPNPVGNTVFTNYSWNPKAVTLFDHTNTTGKKAVLKISYSEKNN